MEGFQRQDSRGEEQSLEPTQRCEINIAARYPFDHGIDLVGEAGELRNHTYSEGCNCSHIDAGGVPVETGRVVKLVDVQSA